MATLSELPNFSEVLVGVTLSVINKTQPTFLKQHIKKEREMSENLSLRTSGGRIVVCHHTEGRHFEEITLTINQVLEVAYYALTNTDLDETGDPRTVFVDRIQSLRLGPGWNKGKQRLVGRVSDPHYEATESPESAPKPSDTVTVDLLVTDKGVKLLEGIDKEQKAEAMTMAVRDELLYHGATAFEVRQVELVVPLLPSLVTEKITDPLTTKVDTEALPQAVKDAQEDKKQYDEEEMMDELFRRKDQ